MANHGSSMREGYWIVAETGAYHLVDDHAMWIQRPENARALGLPEDVVDAIQALPWDFDGPGRRQILRLAMEHGLIRTRGHGPAEVTFEFTIDTEAAVRAVIPFMQATLGPASVPKFNNLRTGESLAFNYGNAMKVIEAGDIAFLWPVWRRPTQSQPVERPFLLLELEEAGAGWHAWSLPQGSTPQHLLVLLRAHAPRGTGWLALEDGRTWRISPTAPPLQPLGEVRPAHARTCPDCGWPTLGASTPCQCENRMACRVCGLPRFWPIPGRDILTLDGQVLHVPLVSGFGHRCVHWPSIHVLPFDDLLRRRA